MQNSLVQQAEDQAAWTWPAEEAHTRDQDCGWIGPRLSTVAGRQRWSWHIRHPSVLAKNGVRRDAGVEHKVQRTAIMNFVLHYRGPLKANGNPEHKHDLRRIFHRQIARLWQQPPLDSCRKWLTPPEAERTYSLRREMAPFVFAPLVTEQMGLYAELQLELLRPEPPGRLLTQAGDMDNRLKTLFDALSMPPHPNALPKNVQPESDEMPFFCLLEDDNLVTSLAVRTIQLLEEKVDESTVELLVGVRIGRTKNTWGNGAFG